MDGFKQECKLCDTIISDDNFKVIEETTKNIFDVLLLKLTLNDEGQNVMCTDCSSKLLAAFNFKSTCAQTDDILFPYNNFENPKPVNLKEMYAKVERSKQEGSMLDDREVCRLCFQPSRDHKSIQAVPVDAIQIYIPEVKFTATTNPVICMKCHDELRVHSSFIRNCLKVEKKRNITATDVKDTFLTESIIKTEEIEIKSEPIDDEMIFEMLCNIKKEQNGEGDTSLHAQNSLIDSKTLYDPDDPKTTSVESTPSNYESEGRIDETASGSRLTGRETQADKSEGDKNKAKHRYGRKSRPKPVRKGLVYKCDKCEYVTRNRRNFVRHLLRHKDPSDVRMYMCDVCDYKSLQKVNLKTHQLKHKDPSEVQKYECDVCDYKSLYKFCLMNHKLTHKSPSEVTMYKCDDCEFETKHKEYLKTHKLRHKNPDEVKMYMCDVCDYKSFRKEELKKHLFRHRDPSKEKAYTCDECDYKSIVKRNLRRHQMIHKDASQVRKYKCDECTYMSHCKSNLKRHQLVHKSPSEVLMYMCDMCDYKSVEKGNLRQHLRVHKDASEVQIYTCDECDFKSVYKCSFKAHQLRHKGPSKMYMCDLCDYKSLRKGTVGQHQLTHKDPEEVQKYKCDDFKTNLQLNFKQLFNSLPSK